MAKTLTFLMFVGLLAMILSLATADFESFKSQFKKSYSASENNRRKAIFQTNLAQIDKLNKVSANDPSAAKFGVNSLSDMDASEFKLTRLGLPTPSASDILKDRVVVINNQKPALTATNYPLDGTFNWDNQSVVTAVKHQSSCGSCWIFAAVSIIETYYARKTGKLISLSEQQMLDCKLRANPCNGGWPTEVFNYTKVIGTVATTSNPYTAVPASTCKAATIVTKIGSYARVTNQNSEQDIINALRTYGTIVMCLNANVLQSYKSGIVTAAQCKTGAPNHAVTLVGYGIESGKKFWRFRNSWGATWGEKGYFRIERNTNACDLQNSYTGYGPWYIAS